MNDNKNLSCVSGSVPFLWQILFIDSETEDSYVVAIQCDVMCNKLCSYLTNVSQLQQYFFMSFKSMWTKHMYVHDTTNK